MRSPSSFHDTEALQARLGARLAAGLGEQAAALPHDVTERLRFAREQALQRARLARAAAVTPAAAPSVMVAGPARAGALALLSGGRPGWGHRLAALLPLAVLVAGLGFIDQVSLREQLHAAADIDAVLLADDLPPSAWTDPGFAEYLKTPQP